MFNSGPLGFVSGGNLSTGRSGRRAGKHERRLEKYERRMDRGRDLSRKKERRYNQYMYEDEQRRGAYGYGPRYGGGQGYGGDYGYGGRSQGLQQRRGPGGPLGMVSGIIRTPGRIVGGVLGGGQSREYEDSYGNRPAPYAPYGGQQEQRRSFDDRDRVYAQQEGYGGAGKAPAPYGNEPAQYGQYGSSLGGRPEYPRSGGSRGQRSGPISTIRRVMKEDVLYLMIVNMPSEEELAEARRLMEAAKAGK